MRSRTNPRPVHPLTRRACRFGLIALGAMVGLSGVACSVDDNSSSRRDPPVYRDEPRESDYPVRDDRPEITIPRDARLAQAGNGLLRYVAPSDGRVWLRDVEDRDTIIYTAKIYRGDEIVVEPAGNKVSVNGRKVLEQDMKKNHKHQLFFDRAEYGGRYGDRHDHEDRR